MIHYIICNNNCPGHISTSACSYNEEHYRKAVAYVYLLINNGIPLHYLTSRPNFIHAQTVLKGKYLKINVRSAEIYDDECFSHGHVINLSMNLNHDMHFCRLLIVQQLQWDQPCKNTSKPGFIDYFDVGR